MLTFHTRVLGVKDFLCFFVEGKQVMEQVGRGCLDYGKVVVDLGGIYVEKYGES
jgi:hypothetical protein